MIQDSRIDLDGLSPFASGTYRDVYVVPNKNGLAVKVLKPTAAFVKKRRIRSFIKQRSAKQLYRFMFREYNCYIEMKIKQSRLGGSLPICEIYGLVQTSKGLGMVVEYAQDSQGQHAKNISEISAMRNIDEQLVKSLNAFIDDVYRLGLRVNDMNPKNLLLDESGEKPRFVLVDGFGDANFIPLKTWSTRANLAGLSRRFSRVASILGLNWDEANRRVILR